MAVFLDLDGPVRLDGVEVFDLGDSFGATANNPHF